MSRLDKIYQKVPIWAQNLGISAYGLYWRWLRFGGEFKQHRQAFIEREQFSLAEWQAWQNERLTGLLTTAIEHVPYYKETCTAEQKKKALAGDLAALPMLEKEALRQNSRAFVRQDIRQKDYTFLTSGTTGTPIASIWTLDENRRSLALREVRSANWAGVSFSMPRATFSGRMVVPDPESKGPYHRYNAAEKQVYFSAFHLKPENARQYVQALWQHKPVWMTGYAVSFYLLATYILDQDLKVPPLKAIITTSEKLTPAMRTVIEKAYGCRVYEEYSTVESVVFASECEHGRLHVSPDAGIVEILRPDGSPCVPGEVGEVVATCLLRDYQPLIRFRLGDLAAWDDAPCPCGRQMPILKEVVGRVEDVVVGPDGRQMVRFHGIFTAQPHVVEGQIIQDALDHICVRLVPSSGFDRKDEIDITARVQQRLGKDVRVTVEIVEFIPRSASGKFKAVISKMND